MRVKNLSAIRSYQNTTRLFIAKTQKGNQVKYIGAIDDNYQDAAAVNVKYLEDAVDALLAGKEIKETKTRAIGCTIKL